ncbi:60S acidic ribosomal protein p0-like [Trifolium pratense]|uniref:60S acidic ribosomal protein p0-like n=1 Tax=Trifolium pratense TaxID=57577 RepID=A0A2K3L8U4_TRIPR|nr:60S acidic ribosomal protein P0-like [Trifolium pratense]XP_045827711.1 60S acidic ribosomal protein P0-like [Trifolium pratense]XP_045827717.1 60S acidic ribosomal protein P0-like [Trifolium pratense]XP_045827726.1 60S acidic ribosomal protein P0-like [Trifolium pratense]PNX74943.1 60S acidic ribosomal protein p0-like [Trifolium pratense]
MAGKVAKAAYDAKMGKLLREYTQVLVVSSDNVGSNQLQGIRRALHEDSVVVMGKNSLMKRSIIQEAEKTGNNNAFLNLVPLLVGNVALIFTKGDLREVSERIAKLKVVNPILMCPKYRSYDSYKTCSYMQSGQLPLGLTCCHQQSSEASEPFLVSSKFSPPQHCYLMRSRQFLMTSIWSPFLLLAGNL